MKISNWIKTLGDLFYPANKVVVSDPVTPDFTPVALNNNLQQVTNKVAGLQDCILKYVVPADVNAIDLTQATDGTGFDQIFSEGNTIQLIFFGSTNVDAILRLRFNNNGSAVYWREVGSNTAQFILSGANSVFTYSQVRFTILWGELIGNVMAQQVNAAGTRAVSRILSSTNGFNSNNITSVNIFGAEGVTIKANSIILICKL